MASATLSTFRGTAAPIGEPLQFLPASNVQAIIAFKRGALNVMRPFTHCPSPLLMPAAATLRTLHASDATITAAPIAYAFTA